MDKITNFQKIRGDGKIIYEGMPPMLIFELGWEIDKVTRVQWEHGDKVVRLDFPDGVLAQVVPSRDAVALQSLDGKRQSVANADGSERLAIPRIQMIRNEPREGVFCWYEQARSGVPTHFAVVFESSFGYVNEKYELEIDSVTGKTVGVWAKNKA